jgi:hypothetical protein
VFRHENQSREARSSRLLVTFRRRFLFFTLRDSKLRADKKIHHEEMTFRPYHKSIFNQRALEGQRGEARKAPGHVRKTTGKCLPEARGGLGRKQASMMRVTEREMVE